MKLKKVEGLKGTISTPGDKSISHRAVMFGSLAKGTTHITNFLSGADCLATIDCFRAMGVRIEQDGTEVTASTDLKNLRNSWMWETAGRRPG